MDAHVIESLLAARASFLSFLERRLGDRAAAEDILQDAYARSMTHGASLRQDESARAWFYRILRNAVIDHRRRDASHGRALDALAAELDEPEAPPPAALAPTTCACVGRLAATMKPEYAAALQRVTVAGQSVKDFAATEGITANNAAVRVFRAREALRSRVRACCGSCADDGCADCTCAPSA
jgi:RNA polymerase sigma-70 factor (ECF subfamily)